MDLPHLLRSTGVMTQTSTALATNSTFGKLLKDWRQRRRMSQLSLALEAEVSARHISFLETGRSAPSRDMIHRLAEGLELPLEIRNSFLGSAGFSPAFRASGWESAELAPLRTSLTRLMDAHAPFPALLLDKHFNVLDANATGALFLQGREPGAETNLIDIMLSDPAARAPILNWDEMAPAMLTRLQAESRHAGGDPVLDEFAERLAALIEPGARHHVPNTPCLTVRYGLGEGVELTLFSTVMEVSSAFDVTISDLRLELFFPADDQSRALLSQ